jgi:hypothetical protein
MGFLAWLIPMLLWLGSIVFGVIMAAALVTYVRRTWQLIRTDEEGPNSQRILDGLDRIEIQLSAMSERIEKLEEHDRMLPPST